MHMVSPLSSSLEIQKLRHKEVNGKAGSCAQGSHTEAPLSFVPLGAPATVGK